MRLAGTVILYHPTAEMIQNILSWLPEIDILYVFDNTETSSSKITSPLQDNPKIIYNSAGVNRGIAARLNQAAKLAISHKFSWLLTMDQDSFFDDGELSNYKTCIDLYNGFEKVAMFGVEFENAKPQKPGKCSSLAVQHLITSGSILNLQLFATVGDFDENYFIDCVDTEYCFRSISIGFSIVKFESIYLNHSLGEIKLYRSLLTLKLTPRTFHSPLRIYYMVRNFLLLSGSYKGKFDNELKVIRKSILTRIKNGFLYGSNRYLLLKFILKARKDFKNNHFGKYP